MPRMRREPKYIPFIYLVKALLTLLENEEKGKPPLSLSEFIKASEIPESSFYYGIRDQLEKLGIVKYVYTRERIIEVHLTDEGHQLAKCLKECSNILKKLKII